MQDEALYAERLLRLGVSGYVMKNVAGTDFLGALRKVARGQRHVSAAMGERLLSQVARGRAPGADEDPVSALTERELEVFRLIGEGISTREISQRLDLSMKTVDAHRRHMREKLNLRSTSELIRYATQWVSDQGGAPGTLRLAERRGARLAGRASESALLRAGMLRSVDPLSKHVMFRRQISDLRTCATHHARREDVRVASDIRGLADIPYTRAPTPSSGRERELPERPPFALLSRPEKS